MKYYLFYKDNEIVGYSNCLNIIDGVECREVSLEEFNDYVRALEIPTQKQIIQRKISELKQQLEETDYKAIKYAEGELTEEEYAFTKEQRRNWRKEINELEEKLVSLT